MEYIMNSAKLYNEFKKAFMAITENKNCLTDKGIWMLYFWYANNTNYVTIDYDNSVFELNAMPPRLELDHWVQFDKGLYDKSALNKYTFIEKMKYSKDYIAFLKINGQEYNFDEVNKNV